MSDTSHLDARRRVAIALSERQEYLDLGGLQLTSLPPEVWQLTSLQILDLSSNQLASLPPEVGQLTSLQSLDLRGNQLASLPPEVGQLTLLQSLALSENQLASLPPEVGQLTSLQSLYLSSNQLASLPPEVGQLTSLQSLYLSGNQLASLPPEVGKIKSLAAAAERDFEPFTNGLFVEDNALPYPYPNLTAAGQPSATILVLAWLRGELSEDDIQGLETLPAPADTDTSEPPPDIPPQGYGPHFTIDDDGTLVFSPIAALDREGNNAARLRKLHPSLRAMATKLKTQLGVGNIPHWHLGERISDYAALIDHDIDQVDFTLLYVEGVRLANAATAAGEKIAEGDLPSLDPQVREALGSLLQLHGTFMLSTAEGIELIAQEERYQRTKREEEAYRAAALAFANSLQNKADVVDPSVATFVLNASQEIGKGANPERSSVAASGTLQNVVITLTSAATLAALSLGAAGSGSLSMMAGAGATVLIVGEGLKKSKPFARVIELITHGLDRASEGEIEQALRTVDTYLRSKLDLVVQNDSALRRLASHHKGLNWLDRSLDWIKSKHERKPDQEE